MIKLICIYIPDHMKIIGHENNTISDEIFMPKEDTDNGDLDEYEREIEEFKRFVNFKLFLFMSAKRCKVKVYFLLRISQ